MSNPQFSAHYTDTSWVKGYPLGHFHAVREAPAEFYMGQLRPYVGLFTQKPTFKTGLVFRWSVYTPQHKRHPYRHLFVVYPFLGMSQAVRTWLAGSLFRVASAALMASSILRMSRSILRLDILALRRSIPSRASFAV